MIATHGNSWTEFQCGSTMVDKGQFRDPRKGFQTGHLSYRNTLFENHQVPGWHGLSQEICSLCGLYKRFVHNIMPRSLCIIVPKIGVALPLGLVCTWNSNSVEIV